jgi:5-oxoprolinase (ATP-hydrolysing)
MASQGIAAERITVLCKTHVKYEGTDSALVVPHGDRAVITAGFEAAHRQRYGFIVTEKPLIVEAVSVEVIGATDQTEDPVYALGADGTPSPLAIAASFMEGVARETPLYDRDAMHPGQHIDGPAIIREATATTVVEPGWRAILDERRYLVLDRVEALPQRVAIGTQVDPVMLEVFNNLFMAIAEQMGVALQNTAYSVNIKERLDFSCAIFDREGALIANAPHMPVHLGSMGESVKTVIAARGADSSGNWRDGRGMKPGDVYVLNAPYAGGTHLPDVTVITPVLAEGAYRSPLPSGRGLGEGEVPPGSLSHYRTAEGPPHLTSPRGERKVCDVLFYVASRGHHADIGGLTPGSMPPDSRTVEEEGVLIDNVLLVDAGRFREAEMIALLSSGRYPSRNPAQNIADLKAQIAAC